MHWKVLALICREQILILECVKWSAQERRWADRQGTFSEVRKLLQIIALVIVLHQQVVFNVLECANILLPCLTLVSVLFYYDCSFEMHMWCHLFSFSSVYHSLHCSPPIFFHSLQEITYITFLSVCCSLCVILHSTFVYFNVLFSLHVRDFIEGLWCKENIKRLSLPSIKN